MTKIRSAVSQAIVAVLFAVLLTACEDLRPYRTELPRGALCNPQQEGRVSRACADYLHEKSDRYDLFFTEFSDQGLQYPSQQYGEADYQINHTIDGLRQIAADPKVNGISILVFVHGWKHNASSDDPNVRDFRKLLQAAADLEDIQQTGYRVVGVYVGWRGLSVRPPFSDLTFWDRKDTATRVAQGSPRELFNRLRNFRCEQNQRVSPNSGAVRIFSDCGASTSTGRRRAKVSTMMIGHSFGAWVLYNALAGSLVESVMQVKEDGRPGTVNLRYADMVVLLNPAFEASRYTPLHRIAESRPYLSTYQAPILVSVTTSADWATRSAFPVGRFLNSIFENATGEEERLATKYTMGHMTEGETTNYITHELTAAGARQGACQRWVNLVGVRSEDHQMRLRQNLEAERDNARDFLARRGGLMSGWQRDFCGGSRLTHTNRASDPNSVIWNVRADETIMRSHNDIEKPELIDFVRQLYLDTILRP